MPDIDEYIDEIRSLWDSHWLTNAGSKHEELRVLLREYMGVEHLELFTNGHMAIELSLQALGLTEGGHHLALYLRVYYPCHSTQRSYTCILRY